MNRYLKARIVLLFGSSEDFAEAIGVNSSIISKVIRGRKVLPERTRNEWARFLRFLSTGRLATRPLSWPNGRGSVCSSARCCSKKVSTIAHG